MLDNSAIFEMSILVNLKSLISKLGDEIGMCQSCRQNLNAKTTDIAARGKKAAFRDEHNGLSG